MSEEIKAKPGAIHIFSASVFGGLIAVIGYVNLMALGHFFPGLGPALYPSQALFSLAGIWFGAWGVLAAYIGNMISVTVMNPLHIAPLLALSTIAQSAIPAIAFRVFKADPRLKTTRDSTIFVIFGVILNSFVGALIGPTVWYIFGTIPTLDFLIYWSIPAWFVSGLIMQTFVSMPLLKVTSAAVMRSRAYVKRWLT